MRPYFIFKSLMFSLLAFELKNFPFISHKCIIYLRICISIACWFPLKEMIYVIEFTPHPVSEFSLIHPASSQDSISFSLALDIFEVVNLSLEICPFNELFSVLKIMNHHLQTTDKKKPVRDITYVSNEQIFLQPTVYVYQSIFEKTLKKVCIPLQNFTRFFKLFFFLRFSPFLVILLQKRAQTVT